MLIEKRSDLQNRLTGKTVLLTGAGGGIGLEAAKAFAYLGAKVIIAEIDRKKGIEAEKVINEGYSEALAKFYEIDLSDEGQLTGFAEEVLNTCGCPDIVFNNATITAIGGVEEVSMAFWEKSYGVNFRAPLYFTQRFLPEMKRRNAGTIVFVSSSGAAPFMGAYEVFKTAQVELSNTLAMELEETDVHTYTIGPGLVKTKTAMEAIEVVASKMGIAPEAFYQMNSHHIIDAESAGVGFALSALDAGVYHGQEIGSIQVLMDYGLLDNHKETSPQEMLQNNEQKDVSLQTEKILTTFQEQYRGWKAMNIFERQWVFRDFKKSMALSAEQALEKLKGIHREVQRGNYQIIWEEKSFFEKLKKYWEHQLKLLKGYEKNSKKLKENTIIINGWIEDIVTLLTSLETQ
jgi:NAD(P)-dependent dehydrogenase (short-subunit alcohol dehydrogenase family)